jgi:hypothetical protein
MGVNCDCLIGRDEVDPVISTEALEAGTRQDQFDPEIGVINGKDEFDKAIGPPLENADVSPAYIWAPAYIRAPADIWLVIADDHGHRVLPLFRPLRGVGKALQ